MKIVFLILLGISLLNAQYLRDDAKEIVIDTKANLMWQDNNETIGVPNKKNWETALDYCKNLTLATYNDWRLPNFNELNRLADKNYSPTINPVFENIITAFYWTSTTDAEDNNKAWHIFFNNATDNVHTKDIRNFVRCVR